MGQEFLDGTCFVVFLGAPRLSPNAADRIPIKKKIRTSNYEIFLQARLSRT